MLARKHKATNIVYLCMPKQLFIYICVLFIAASVISACDRRHSGTLNIALKQNTGNYVNDSLLDKAIRETTHLDAKRPLNFNIVNTFSNPQKLLIQTNPLQNVTQSVFLDNHVAKQRLHFSGRVFTNFDIESRLPSIDGGAVSLQMRFK